MKKEDRDFNVSPLKRVYVAIEVGTSETAMNISTEPITFGFIFGIDTEGLSPLECILADKRIGDEVCISLKSDLIHSTFHQFPVSEIELPDGVTQAYFRIKVTGVETVSDREVVKAMAAKNDCGCGCAACGGL